MALGTNNITVTTAANFLPELWSNEVIAAYKRNLVIGNLVTKINHKGKRGDTIHIPGFTRSAASVKAAGSQVTLSAPTHGVTNISINQHYEYSKLLEDIVEKQALSSLRRAYTEDAGYALALQVDSGIHAEFESLQGGGASGTGAWAGAVIGGDGTTAYDQTAATNVGNGTDITDAGIRGMILTLDNADIPMENRSFVIPPISKSDLLGISRFTEQAFTGQSGKGNPIINGRVGEIYGMPVFVSSNCPTEVAVDTSTTYRVGHMFHKSTMAYVEQMAVRTQTQYKQEYLADLFTADCLYGLGELRNDGGISFVVPST